MIIWKKDERKLNINDIAKFIDILPCSWAEEYEKPNADGDNLIYAIVDDSDGYITIYYKCSADGTILETGYDEDDEDW